MTAKPHHEALTTSSFGRTAAQAGAGGSWWSRRWEKWACGGAATGQVPAHGSELEGVVAHDESSSWACGELMLGGLTVLNASATFRGLLRQTSRKCGA